MMPIIHDLAMHFQSIEFDWITREENGSADALARNAAVDDVAERI